MKNLKEKKGFTLIELLAVIVVLAIVMVLAATTVLPYMTSARQESFALEANAAKDAASNAVSLIMIGELDSSNYTETKDGSGNVTGYCFTIKNLKDAGLFEKDDDKYTGVVKVSKTSNAYTYLVEMQNDEFFVKQTAAGDVKTENVSARTDATNDVTVACS